MRQASLSSPTTEALRTFGAEVRVRDIKESVEILSLALKGVDSLISAVSGALVLDQKGLLSAAKTVGVQRVIPC
ncbi:hypothetical protein BD311DRAFT_764563, partial [Dichomitus squalens]